MRLTKPLSETSSESQRRVNPAVRIVDKVSRCRKSNRHLKERLDDSPHTGADQAVCNNHVSRAAVGKSLSGTDEDTGSDVGTE